MKSVNTMNLDKSTDSTMELSEKLLSGRYTLDDLNEARKEFPDGVEVSRSSIGKVVIVTTLRVVAYSSEYAQERGLTGYISGTDSSFVVFPAVVTELYEGSKRIQTCDEPIVIPPKKRADLWRKK